LQVFAIIKNSASGGYWISMNANKIVATEMTITGSIGVVGLKVLKFLIL
jgi:protease-4